MASLLTPVRALSTCARPTSVEWPPVPAHRSPMPDARALPARLLALVRAPPAGPAVAPHPRSLPRAGLGDHAAADAGRARHPQVPRVPRPLPDASSRLARRDARGRAADLVPARLQHPPACISTASPARRWPATAAGCPTTPPRSGGMRGIGRYTAGAMLCLRLRAGRRRSWTPTCAGCWAASSSGRGGWRGCAARRPCGTSPNRSCPPERVYDYNQALMDFGATWCTARAPRCRALPHEGLLRELSEMPPTGDAMGALDGKVALVAGGGTGIGRAIAELFARGGRARGRVRPPPRAAAPTRERDRERPAATALADQRATWARGGRGAPGGGRPRRVRRRGRHGQLARRSACGRR